MVLSTVRLPGHRAGPVCGTWQSAPVRVAGSRHDEARRLLWCAEVGPAVGLGHVMRGLPLAESADRADVRCDLVLIGGEVPPVDLSAFRSVSRRRSFDAAVAEPGDVVVGYPSDPAGTHCVSPFSGVARPGAGPVAGPGPHMRCASVSCYRMSHLIVGFEASHLSKPGVLTKYAS